MALAAGWERGNRFASAAGVGHYRATEGEMRNLVGCLVVLWGLGGCAGDGGVGPGVVLPAVDAADGLEATSDVSDDAAHPLDATEAEVGSEDSSEFMDISRPPDSSEGDVSRPPDGFGDAEDVVEPPPTPPAIWLTVAEVPRDMNGSIESIEAPLAWRLRVNRAHVTLDVFRDATSGPVDWETLSVECDEGGPSRVLGPIEVLGEHHARVLIDDETAFADGARVLCVAAVGGPGGTTSAAYAFDAATLPLELDPFDAPDQWLITTSRDMFRITVETRLDKTAQVDSTYVPGGSGVPDLDEALRVLGLFTAEAPEAATVIRAHLLARVRANVHRFFGLSGGDLLAPRIRLAFEGTIEAEPYLRMDAEALDAAGVSRIALGGDGSPADQRAGTFGRALVDWNNQDTEDDTVYGLGVFPTALVRAALNQPIAVVLLESLRPDLGGVPFGAHPGDVYFIGMDGIPDTLPPIDGIDDRAFYYDLIVNFTALGLASILTHEIGHSLGLVPYGPPPLGLFAGVDVDFVDTIAPDAHIDTAGLNIMQTGGSANIGAILGGEDPLFEPLSIAYLRRMLVVGPPLQ